MNALSCIVVCKGNQDNDTNEGGGGGDWLFVKSSSTGFGLSLAWEGGGRLGYVLVMTACQMEARRSHSSGRGNAFHCAFPSGASAVCEARGLT